MQNGSVRHRLRLVPLAIDAERNPGIERRS
jgi:hypothetical protein